MPYWLIKHMENFTFALARSHRDRTINTGSDVIQWPGRILRSKADCVRIDGCWEMQLEFKQSAATTKRLHSFQQVGKIACPLHEGDSTNGCHIPGFSNAIKRTKYCESVHRRRVRHWHHRYMSALRAEFTKSWHCRDERRANQSWAVTATECAQMLRHEKDSSKASKIT
jgi:hypothetical protein